MIPFLEKSILVHGHKYNYDKVEYINAHTPVAILCPIHGEFLQRPHAHTNLKQGCPACGLANRKHPGQKTTAKFLSQATAKWGNKYNYNKTIYINKTTKIIFNCPVHGDIEQLPTLHLRTGCQFCAGRGVSRHSKESFINIANKIHENKYNYNKTTFLRINDIITIGCPVHGDFQQRAGNHIHLKNGCPHCSYLLRTSKAEKDILNYIKSIYSGPVLENDRIALKGKEIDIFLPDRGLGIEYHGLYWHLETIRGRLHHYLKWKAAKEAGIKLIQIYSNEWVSKETILKSKLNNYLGIGQRIHGRKTTVVKLDLHTKNEFLECNHLQGADSSKIAYGLEYNGEIVSCMTFGPSRFNKNYKYELLRFCNRLNLSVMGGAGKLLKHFREEYIGNIISYADKRYSSGGLYEKLGFTLDGETRPSFSYVEIKSGLLFNRMNFQKKLLKNNSYYSDEKTEYEIMQLNGYDRIWDAGQYRFILN